MNLDIIISDYPAIRFGIGNKVLCKWGLGAKALDKYDVGFASFSEYNLKRLIDDFPTLCPNGRVVRGANYIKLVPSGCKCIGTLLVYTYLVSRGYGIALLPDVTNDDFTELICEFLKLAAYMYDTMRISPDCEGTLSAVQDLIDEMIEIVQQ